MRVLLYSANFAPEPTGIGKYSGELASWLAQDHDVRVVAAPPYYPAWKRDPKYTWPPYRREQWNGVDVWRAPLWVPNCPGGLARILHLLSFALCSLPVMLRQVFWRPDLIITVAPALLCAPAGWLTARLCGSRCWLHLQDFEIDVAFQLGLLKNKLVQRAMLRLERWLFRRFDDVSSISKRMVERLIAKGVPAERTHYFPNWVDIAHVRPSIVSGKYREELGIDPDATVVLFSGSLGGKQGLLVIPEAAAILSERDDIVFVICGNGVMKPTLQAAAANLRNVRFLPLQPVERLGELLSMANIHLLPQSPGAADLVLPSKLSGMLASGRPVIATCDATSEIAEVVAHCGLVVPAENGAALAQAVATLASEPDSRRELGRRARAWAVAHCGRDEVLERVFGSMQTPDRLTRRPAVYKTAQSPSAVDVARDTVVVPLATAADLDAPGFECNEELVDDAVVNNAAA